MKAKANMFTQSGNWYKGNIHAHTTNSDGCWTPEQVVKAYKEQGYSFMCLSEHDYYTDLRQQFDSEDFILLPGLEASVYLFDVDDTALDVDELTDGKGRLDMIRPELVKIVQAHPEIKRVKTHHIHGILGNEKMQTSAGENCFFENEHTPVKVYFDSWHGVKAAEEMSEYLKSRGCFTTYNHPVWSRVDIEDVREAKGFWGIEVYNYATVNECGEGEDTTFLNSMLKQGTDICVFAADDNHNTGDYPESFGGFIMVQANELSHESIVNAMLEGRFYASSGPEICQWGICDGKAYVECGPAKRVNFVVGGQVGSGKTVCAPEGETITYAEYPLKDEYTFVRIEIVDEKDRKAWTNPVMLKYPVKPADDRATKVHRLRYGMEDETGLIFEEMLAALEREEALENRLKDLEKKKESVHCRNRQLKDYLE